MLIVQIYNFNFSFLTCGLIFAIVLNRRRFAPGQYVFEENRHLVCSRVDSAFRAILVQGISVEFRWATDFKSGIGHGVPLTKRQ